MFKVTFEKDSYENWQSMMFACMAAQNLLKKHKIKYDLKTIKPDHPFGRADVTCYEITLNSVEDYTTYQLIK